MPTTGYDIEQAVRELLRSPGGVANGLRGVEGLVPEALQVAEAEAAAAEGAGAAVAIESFSDFLAAFAGWIVILAIAAVIVLGKVVEAGLLALCSKFSWIWGGGPATLVRAIFRPLDQLEEWVGQKLADFSTIVIIKLFLAIRQFLTFELGSVRSGSGGATSTQVHHLQDEINLLNTRIGHLQSEIVALQHQTQPVVQPAPGLATLEERVTRLERFMPVISHDLNVLHSDIVQLSHNENATHAEVTALEKALAGVRAEQFGVQDVLQQVQTTTANIQTELNRALPQLDADTRHLHALAPLSLLLVNGAAGLKNLEKLERKPCQCPRLPGLSGPDYDFLAEYEFITNG